MNRTDFDALEVLEQIKYINKSLLGGYTVTGICNHIGIGRSTIRDRFEKVGYKYNKTINQYETIVEVIEAEPEPIREAIEPVIQESSNLVVETDSDILTTIINNYDDNMNKLNEMYNWYKLQSSNKVVETGKLKIDDFEGDIVVRSYKLYESIQKEFTEFCKVNNKYKVHDILCQFIKEGLEKYK